MSSTAPFTVVSSAEFVRQFGRWQDEASTRPVLITHHGRGRLVVVSTAQYQGLTAGAGGAPPPDDGRDAAEQLLDHVAQGFVAFDPDMRVTAVNRAACAFLKLSAASLVGRTMAERMPGVEGSVGYASLVRAARAGAIASFELPSFAYPDRWLELQTFPFRDGAACLFRDITDEVADRHLADARSAALAALAAHGGIGRATLSGRGTFTRVDEAFAGLVGFRPEGLLRARLADITAPPDRRRVAAMVEAVLTGDGPQGCDATVVSSAGAECPVRLAAAPVRVRGAVESAEILMTLAAREGR